MPKCASAEVPWVSEWLSTLSAWVPECPPSAQMSEGFPSVLNVSTFWASVNLYLVPQCLMRCDWNEILSIKRCFVYMQKEN